MKAKTIHNYAARAERGLVKQADRSRAFGRKNDARAARTVGSWLPDAVHFSMPDNGLLFDDNLRGLQHTDVHLPYDKITIEYFVTDTYHSTKETPNYVPHRLIFAERIGKQTMLDRLAELTGRATDSAAWLDIPGDELIAIYPICAATDHVWQLYPAAACVPTAWADVTNAEWARHGRFDGYNPAKRRDGLEERRKENNIGLSMSIVPILPDACRYLEQTVGYDEATRMFANDLIMEVRTLYEFCEAMMCCNIEGEIVQHAGRAALNDKRRRKGKLPTYETRVLALVRPGESSESVPGAGHDERRGPRQHLRRGHIRRLPDERKIWVQPCLVGAADSGVIDKSYRVSTQ